MSDTEYDKKEGGKKKDGKKEKKEKGYVMIEADGSDEELVGQEDLKSPSKMKKGKAFRFGPKKDIFPKTKEEKKEKEGKKEEKEKRKEEKEGKKHKLKVKKKSKHHDLQTAAVPALIEKPVFGVPLSVALERNRSHDGIQLPALFRECIDYIEEHGLHCEGIYRISGVKSKVQHLKDSYNRGEPVYLEEHEPNIVAGVLKQFLRELPEPVLTNALRPKFEEASTIRNERKRVESFLKLLKDLPECNRLLLSWTIVHMTHVIERQQENKMTLQNVSIVLSPTMQISHRVLNVLFCHSRQLFRNVLIKRYVPPLKPATSRWSLELPDNPQALQEELSKQESLLNQLHEELAAGKADPEKEEQIWEVQRVCTQLKRKIKLAQKNQDSIEKRRKDREEQSKRNTVVEEGEEELRLELREVPECEELKLELRTPPEDVPKPPEMEDSEKESSVDRDSREITPAGSQSQKEAEGKSKVTLKELANQNKSKKPDEVEQSNVNLDNKTTEKEDESEKKTEVVTEVKDKESVSVENENTESRKTETAEVKAEIINKHAEETEQAAAVSTEVKETEEEEVKDLTAEEVIADIEKKKQQALLNEDTTDSELGKSTENIQEKTGISDDEFEHSLEEILERDLNVESDREATDHEMTEESTKVSEEAETTVESTADDTEGTTAMETKTPVPQDTPESPPTTPIPQAMEEVVSGKEGADEGQVTIQVKELEAPEKVVATVQDVPEGPIVSEGPTVSEGPVVTEGPAASETSGMSEASGMSEMSGMSETSGTSEVSEDESFDEEEYQQLLEEEHALKLEEEELLAIESELRKKIETERCEAERLAQEIEELQYLRQDSDEEMMSSSSDSSYESEDEDDLQEILSQLIKENEDLERNNSELCGKIHEERMICLEVKVQIGLIQQRQVKNSVGSNVDDSLIEFD